MPRRGSRDLAEYLPFWLALSALGALPLGAAEAVGEGLGVLAYGLLRRRRRVALDNLELVFGEELEPAPRRAIARASFRSLGRLLAGFSQLPRVDRGWLDRHITIEGAGHLESARREEKGVLILAAHFGSWELIPMVQAALGHPMAFIVRPADNPRIEALIRRYRERLGNAAIAKREALRECLTRLKNKEVVGLLIDQHVPADRGAPTCLLGQRTHTVSALAALALKTGAPVLPAFALPRGLGRHHLVYGAPVAPVLGAGRDQEIQDTTERYVAVVEGWVRAHPGLWLWSHRRFRGESAPPLA